MTCLRKRLNIFKGQLVGKFVFKIFFYRKNMKIIHNYPLGPSRNGLVTDGNTKLCCRGFILTLFKSTTANKIDSEHTRHYKRFTPGMRS